MDKQENMYSNEEFKKHTVEEIAKMLGLGKTKTRELLQRKILPVTKIGRDYFTSRTAIQTFLTDNMGNEFVV